MKRRNKDANKVKARKKLPLSQREKIQSSLRLVDSGIVPVSISFRATYWAASSVDRGHNHHGWFDLPPDGVFSDHGSADIKPALMATPVVGVSGSPANPTHLSGDCVEASGLSIPFES